MSEPLPAMEGAPDWFRRALAVPFTDGHVDVHGTDIHYLAWGEPGRRGLVFVHGGAAHAHWWTHVAATFAQDFRVVAVDLSGHGDSGRADDYGIEAWTDQVMAAAEHGGIAGKPVVIGHSMGGFVTIVTAALHAEKLSGVIVCDSPVTTPDPEVQSSSLSEFKRPRAYPSVEAALARFRTVPPQHSYLDYVMDHVGRRSLRPVEGGYQWKFDNTVFQQFQNGLRAVARPYLGRVTCRFALLRSEYGLVTDDIGQYMYEQLGRVAPIVELPEAGHHAMLDQPLVLMTAIRTLLADWDHSDPHRRQP